MNEVTAKFIDNESKINLKAGDLFDRIINLKLTCSKVDSNGKPVGEPEVFVIRSDYELVYPNTSFMADRSSTEYKGKFIIRRCTQKPSIKVQCKMVTSNTGTSIGITVSNFIMLTHDGKHIRSFNAEEYIVTSVEIVMGYWGQLKGSIDFNVSDEQLLQSYFDIKAVNGADKISITNGKPIVVTTEKLPPDSAIHIKGFVADIYSSPVAVTKVNTPVKALSKPIAKSGTEFETVLFENITRRYLNGHKTMGVNKQFELTDEGQLSDSDAKDYGVRVFLSDKAKETKLASIEDSNGSKQPCKIYFEQGWTIGHTLSRIFSYMNADLDYTFSLDGDVIIYVPNEMQDPENIGKACDEQGMYKETVLKKKQLYDSKLPAVYNINIDAVATITCPFFTFLQPFQYIEFASRYALNGLVSYYANYAPTVQRFLVINATISFATVDDVNEVHITAVSSKDKTA